MGLRCRAWQIAKEVAEVVSPRLPWTALPRSLARSLAASAQGMKRALVRLAFTAMACGACAAGLGCDPESIDPTAQFFQISFNNDLSRPAVLKDCSDTDCHEFRHTSHVDPQGTVRDNISDRGVYTTWFVQAEGGRPSCLALKFEETYDDIVVYLSQAKPLPCPDQPLLIEDVKHGASRGHE